MVDEIYYIDYYQFGWHVVTLKSDFDVQQILPLNDDIPSIYG